VRTAWFAATVQLAAPVAAAVIVGAVIARRLTGQPEVTTVAGIAIGVAVAGLAVAALALRLSDWDVARAAERGLGAGDTLTTALEFTDDDDPLHREVQRRAVRILDRANATEAVPYRVDALRLRRAGLIGALALVLAVLPSLRPGPALSADETTLLNAEADRIEEIAEAIDAQVDDGDDIAGELRALADELRNARSLDEGIRELDRSSTRLEAAADPRALTERAAVQGLARDLALRPLADGASDAASQLDALAEALGNLSPQEQAAVADRLAALAESQTAGNPGLASSLASAAQAVGSGNNGAASSALRSAAANYRTAVDSARNQQALDEALRAIAGASARLGTSQPGSGQGEGEGNGAGTGQGNGSGQGNGGGSGGGQAGSASPSGSISGVRGGDGGSAGIGAAGTVGAGGDVGEERDVLTGTVFEPADIGGVSDQLQVGVDGGVGDGAIVGRGEAPTELGDALVPYTQVLPTYLADAADALDQLELSPSLRSIVRSYFDLLAQQAR